LDVGVIQWWGRLVLLAWIEENPDLNRTNLGGRVKAARVNGGNP